MDRRGPRVVNEIGVVLIGAGLLLATFVHEPWHLYATLGMLVGGGSVCLGYTGQALFLPNWFVRRRGLAMSLAFSGVGVGSIILLPWLQRLIARAGWRACLLRHGHSGACCCCCRSICWCDSGRRTSDSNRTATAPRTHAIARRADAPMSSTRPGSRSTGRSAAPCAPSRFWWIAIGYFCALFAWYAVQVHQTKYLMEVGFSPSIAAWALGAVSLAGIPGQIALGHLSDRIGREFVWCIGSLGFVLCCLLLLLLRQSPSPALLYLMVVAQGALGYGVTSVIGAIPAEIFQGRHYGTIFGTLMLASITGGAVGPWLTGVLHDATGSYDRRLLDRARLQRAVRAGHLARRAAQGASRRRAHRPTGLTTLIVRLRRRAQPRQAWHRCRDRR